MHRNNYIPRRGKTMHRSNDTYMEIYKENTHEGNYIRKNDI